MRPPRFNIGRQDATERTVFPTLITLNTNPPAFTMGCKTGIDAAETTFKINKRIQKNTKEYKRM